ncbi:MAG TPA: hypothetical protein VEY09_06115 [Pyrinomonadaceae bacterium]|nr:hypothetical protein [Pyrinomonadaceae bacterium]
MLAKAQLVEIKWDADQQQAEKVEGGKSVEAQFNPQTLKLSFSNENKGGDQPGGSSKQFVGSGKSKMSVELLFDTTADGSDVRKKTEAVAFFIQAKPQQDDPKSKRTPPGVSFEWGSFIFRGTVDSMDETLDYFSEEGVPMRASISLSISRQEIEFLFGQPGQASGAQPGTPGPTAGTEQHQAARPNDSVQSMAGRAGKASDWKAIAAANNIDDPLRLQAGALVNLNAGVGVKAGAGLRAGASPAAGANFGASAGVNVNANANVSARAGANASASAGASAGARAGARAGASARVRGRRA